MTAFHKSFVCIRIFRVCFFVHSYTAQSKCDTSKIIKLCKIFSNYFSLRCYQNRYPFCLHTVRKYFCSNGIGINNISTLSIKKPTEINGNSQSRRMSTTMREHEDIKQTTTIATWNYNVVIVIYRAWNLVSSWLYLILSCHRNHFNSSFFCVSTDREVAILVLFPLISDEFNRFWNSLFFSFLVSNCPSDPIVIFSKYGVACAIERHCMRAAINYIC